MNGLKYNCEIITPMFIYGSDGKTSELRPPSLKGMMRYWWRAAQAESDIAKMKKKEDAIFGDSGEKGKSKFSLIVKCKSDAERYPMLPHRIGGNKLYRSALIKKDFDVIIPFRRFGEEFSERHLDALFKLTSWLSGLGRRSRRGFGAFAIKDDDSKYADLNYLFELIEIISTHKFEMNSKKDAIFLKESCDAKYPYIKEIRIGKHYSEGDSLLKTIGQASHETAKEGHSKVLGYAKEKKRLASPIYVSMVKSNSKYYPIITTLNMDYVERVTKEGLEIQNNFKDAILQKEFEK